MAKASKAIKAVKLKPIEPWKLDLGAGQNKREGFTGVDIAPTSDIQCDLFKFPWPFDNESVAEVHCSHFFEHVPQQLRGKFMDELYRVLVKGGTGFFITPYWSSMRAIQDPSHMWPPIAESSYLYFNKGWREANKLDHYDIHCDFDFGYGYGMDQETAARNPETQQFWAKHYVNSVSDLHVTVTKRG